MPNSPSNGISWRKAPKQARSNELVAAILEAAVQVLAQQGAHRFTTARVAERAGVSVGSLYQYFPNKAAILFRLQSDEWRQTLGLLGEILGESTKPPLDRLRALVHAFLQSECDEADIRGALNDAAPLYRDAPEARKPREAQDALIGRFMLEALPDAAPEVRARCGELVMTTLKTVGERFSSTPRTPDEIANYADAMADMLCGYVRNIGGAG